MAHSVACDQFPQIVWKNGEKQLWNPIRRQTLKNLPEERVRLRIVEYLIHGGWSKHRISTEEAIIDSSNEAALRTDLLCYTHDFKPFLLIECKAENIKLSAKTAEQIARYNRNIQSPFLMMSNGRTDYWYEMKEEKMAVPLNDIPGALPVVKFPETNYSYWNDRGFCGKKASSDLRKWIKNALDITLRKTDANALRYLSFKKKPGEVDLRNYYRIQPINHDRLALGFTATPFGGNRLIGILNRNKQNEAVLEINLDLLFDDRSPNGSIYWAGDTQNVDIRQHIPRFTDNHFAVQAAAESFHQLLVAAIH